jgi:hypothetical protein
MMPMIVDRDTAFKPYTREEMKAAKDAQEAARIAAQEVKNNLAEMVKDPKFQELKERVTNLNKLAQAAMLNIDMTDPARFSLQSDARVYHDLVEYFERRSKS